MCSKACNVKVICIYLYYKHKAYDKMTSTEAWCPPLPFNHMVHGYCLKRYVTEKYLCWGVKPRCEQSPVTHILSIFPYLFHIYLSVATHTKVSSVLITFFHLVKLFVNYLVVCLSIYPHQIILHERPNDTSATTP